MEATTERVFFHFLNSSSAAIFRCQIWASNDAHSVRWAREEKCNFQTSKEKVQKLTIKMLFRLEYDDLLDFSTSQDDIRLKTGLVD